MAVNYQGRKMFILPLPEYKCSCGKEAKYRIMKTPHECIEFCCEDCVKEREKKNRRIHG